MFERIKKRDARIVEFDSSAIILAIAKAGKATGTELEQATCTMNLGIVHRQMGRFHEAENGYGDAPRVYRSIPGAN